MIHQIAWGVAQSSYDITVADVRRSTGLKLRKKQVEDLAIHASVDFESFYLDRAVQPVDSGELVVLTFDGKGVVMLPSGLREGTRRHRRPARLHPGARLRWENDKVSISETADKLLRSLVLAREPIDDHAAWDARLGSLAKADPEPLVLLMVTEGRTWASAA